MNPANMNLIFIGLMIAVFYFFIILPQVRKTKAQRKFMDELKKGDKVVTTGGLHGKVDSLDKTTIMLDAGGGIRLKVERSAINMDTTQLLEKNQS
jgi:preprotein translocase subunit YajC